MKLELKGGNRKKLSLKQKMLTPSTLNSEIFLFKEKKVLLSFGDDHASFTKGNYLNVWVEIILEAVN